jgi:hypothetical protein
MEGFPDIVEPEIIIKIEKIMKKKSPVQKIFCQMKQIFLDNLLMSLAIIIFFAFLFYRYYQVNYVKRTDLQKQIDLEKERQLHYYLYVH